MNIILFYDRDKIYYKLTFVIIDGCMSVKKNLKNQGLTQIHLNNFYLRETWACSPAMHFIYLFDVQYIVIQYRKITELYDI